MTRTLALVSLFFVVLITASCGDKPDIYSVSIPDLKASSDESIVSLEIGVNAGTVQSVSNIPIGWQVSIDNDANWMSRIRARSTIGAASLAPDELKRVRFNVRRNESETFKFDLTGTLSLSKTFETRKLAIRMQDFALKPGE